MLPIFWPPILMLLIVLLFMFWLGYSFLFDIIALFVNGAILYLIGLRAYAEIEEGKINLYLTAAAIGAIIAVLTGNFLQRYFVWMFTLWIIISFAIAQGVIIYHYYYSKHQKKKKRK